MSKWTNEQLLAINSEGKNIIVSAGAGSGKTAVLSERVLRKINDNVPINKLLILTFTNEAAKEMKDRIRKKLINEKKSDQLNLLEESYITTFDSYSLSIVKKYHYLLNVSKDIKIIDDTIISNLKDKFIDEIFEELYKNACGAEHVAYKNVLDLICNAQTIDMAPLVHGKWKCQEPCPICGKDRFDGLDADIWADWEPPFCPNCGAKMDLEVTNDA